jgi:hypothetical protein
MDLVLKFAYREDLDVSLLAGLRDGNFRNAKLTANKLNIERDKDERNIKALKGVKLSFELKDGSSLSIRGNLGCSFRQPFGGEFYAQNVDVYENVSFKGIRGVDCRVAFNNSPHDINYIQSMLGEISRHKDFVFNVSQFDDFMEVFGYYKKLSEELNNSASYKIKKISKPYYFAPVDVKELYINGELQKDYKALEEVFDFQGLLKGYMVDEYIYELMDNFLKDQIRFLVDITIDRNEDTLKNIKSMSDNLYVSNFSEINEKNAGQLIELTLENIYSTKDQIVLAVEHLEDFKYQYINLYDMGQKVKIDSIETSLKLINQGQTGSAIQLIEFLIGDTPMPNTNRNMSNEIKMKYLLGLNESQKQAFLKAIDGSPVTLIKGPPGTGKTHVINAITQYITKELKEKVVISSQTHVAIDNVLDKLMENHDLVVPNRITNRRNKYSDKEIDITLYKTWATNINNHMNRSNDKELVEKVLNDLSRFKGEKKMRFSENMSTSDFSVIGATTTTSAIAGRKGIELLKEYKWLIIDEVSKSPITEVLRYLPYIDKIILVGDDFQLAPLLEFKKDDVKHLPSYDEEKFERLETMYQQSVFSKTIKKAEESHRLVVLNENYRSLSSVLRMYNVFYDYKLVNRREEISNRKVFFSEQKNFLNEKDVFFVEVIGGKELYEGTSRYNNEEISATALILQEILANTLNPSKVTVAAIFPYAAQISRFTKKYKDLINQAKRVFKNFDVDTVDAFQGKESDIVLVNTVVVDLSRGNFLSDFRRINVSMSRAKDKLFIFGNSIVLSRIEMQILGGQKRKYFKEIIEDITIRQYGTKIKYQEGELNYEASSKSQIEFA